MYKRQNLKCIALSAYKFNTQRHRHRHTDTDTQTHRHTDTPLDTQAPKGSGTEEKDFERRKVFREDLKELTEDA